MWLLTSFSKMSSAKRSNLESSVKMDVVRCAAARPSENGASIRNSRKTGFFLICDMITAPGGDLLYSKYIDAVGGK